MTVYFEEEGALSIACRMRKRLAEEVVEGSTGLYRMSL